MNAKSTAKTLLNISLVLHGIYFVLFMAGYVIQKPIWNIFGVTEEISQLSPIISPAIVIGAVLTLALSAALNVLLRKQTNVAVGVVTVVFCVCAFAADRLTKAISCVECALSARVNGVDCVYLAGFHENSVQFLDTFLLIFLAAGLALLPCAYCVMRYGEKENNFSKG